MKRSEKLADSAENVDRGFASDVVSASSLRKNEICEERKCVSEPNIGYCVDYDDLCGPWRFAKNPAHVREDNILTPRLCIWELLTAESIGCIRNCNQNDKRAIKLVIGELSHEETQYFEFQGVTLMVLSLDNVLKKEVLFVGEARNIFLELGWSIIRFAR